MPVSCGVLNQGRMRDGSGRKRKGMIRMHTVQDGLWPVTFSGTPLGPTVRTRREIPGDRDWEDLEPWEKKGIARWVSMTLYRVPAQDDPAGRIALPDGGYLYHVVGESLVYHHIRGCRKGVPKTAAETTPDMLPCWECSPAPPDFLWEEWEDESTEPAALIVDPELELRVETPHHTLKRARTAEDAVRKIIGERMSMPAQQLLETAMRKDPEIAAVFSPPVARTTC
jgi:hypothetical protein